MRRTAALVSTALVSTALSLAACQTTETASSQLPAYQQRIANANAQAQSSLNQLPPNSQLAAVQTGTRSDVPSGILQPGTIILRRTSTVEKPIPPEKLAQTVERIARETATATAASTAAKTASQIADARVEAEKPLILAAADARITSVAGALENARQQELAETEARLKSYTDSTHQQAASKTAEELKAYADQLNDLSSRTDLQLSAIRDYTQQGTQIAELKAVQSAEKTARELTAGAESTARQVASQAEGRAKEFVVDELSIRQRQTDSRLAELLTQTNANQQILLTQLASLKDTLGTQLAASQQLNTEKLNTAKAQTAAELAKSMAATNSQIQSTQAQLAQLANQTTQSLAEVKAQQQTLAQSGKDYARAEALAAQLEAQKTAIQQAQSSAAKAEERAIQFTAAQMAEAKAQQQALAQSGKDYARAEALAAQLEAQKTAIQQAQSSAAKAETNAREFATNQLAMAEMKRSFAEQQTNRQLAEIKAAQAAQAELTRQATAAVAESLKIYADTQIASLQSETARTIEATARISQMQSDSLATQTALRLAQIRAEAANRSEQTATTLSNKFASQLNKAIKQTEAKALKPDEVLVLAQTAVQDATPQLRAIALQSLADSQDYIRTIAQESLTDEADPKVQEALQQAAKNVITKDDQVVFAIRQALVTPVSSTTQTAARTVLGNGHSFAGDILPPPALGADVAIDPAKLLVAPIGGFGVEPAAGDSAETAPTRLASLNPKTASMGNPRYKQDWLDLRKYRVVVHEDSRTLEKLMDKIMIDAEPYVGPWTLKWKISRENKDLLAERFSLDAETTFADFVTYISQYVLNERGVKLSFNLFDAERILVISD